MSITDNAQSALIELLAAIDARHEAVSNRHDDSQVASSVENFWQKVAAARAALATTPVGGEPAGWKLVPVEPTDKMLREGWNAYLEDIKGGFHRFSATYRAMLAAAPTNSGASSQLATAEDSSSVASPAPGSLPVPEAVREALCTFLNAAAGEGLILDGIDAADVYIALYPERYAATIDSAKVE